MIETKYYFKDEFGQEIETRKTYTEDVLETDNTINLMFTDFINHLKSCGYTEKMIKEYAGYHFK